MLQCELLEIVRRNKPQLDYEISNYAVAMGHTALKLPPYHCDLNPIEVVWSMLKRKGASRNLDGSCNVEGLIMQAFAEITSDLWQMDRKYVKKLIE
ncbi:hypothetical protein Trydic_g6825 [Trypoxylus dichotomus]